MSDTIKLAIIGCGNISLNFHIPTLQALNIEIIAVSDVSSHALDAAKSYFKDSPNTISFHASDEEFNLDEINTVLICTPTKFHYPLSKKYLKLNKHVFCEKPMCISKNEGEELIKIAHEKQLVYQVGYYRRFHNSANFIKNAIDSREFGVLKSIEVNAGWDSKNTLPNSLLDKNLSGGGILMDYGVHLIDRLFSWFEEISVKNYRDDNKGGIESNCILDLVGTDIHGVKTPIELRSSWTNELGNDLVIKFENHHFFLTINGGNAIKHVAFNKHTGRLNRSVYEEDIVFEEQQNDCEKQWLEFSERLKNNNEQTSSLSDALKTQEIVEYCYSNRKDLEFSWGY